MAERLGARAQRGEEVLRRRHRLPREGDPPAAPRRDPGARRSRRQHGPRLRARLLDPAPQPEGRRGDAVARPRRASSSRRWARSPCRARRRSATSPPARSSSSSREDGSFYFLEMNTRLQVEHPVTELVTGLDLVREMVLVAQGEKLGVRAGRSRVARRGHRVPRLRRGSVERLPPVAGRIESLVVPAGPGVRDDGGAYPGCTISSYYDPLISKLSVWAPTRERAVARMRRALSRVRRHGHPHEPRVPREALRAPRVRRRQLRHRLPRAAQGRRSSATRS